MTSPEISLDPDVLIAEAVNRANGRDDLGGGHFRTALQLFTNSLEREANLNEMGRLIASERILGHTKNRLDYIADRALYPEIATQEITRPVFIIGLPRTGTTILHDILAQDPVSRAPLTWEVSFPSPPPETETYLTDPRIALCQSFFPDPDDMEDDFAAIHPMGAMLAQECIVMFGEEMCTPLMHCQFNVPTYQDWVDDGADYGVVYDFYHKQLQHLQSRHHGDRWVLKTGGHMWGLEHLLERYPDARIVFTHRDPVESVTSFASLTTVVRSAGSSEVDPIGIASDWTARLEKAVNHALEVRDAGDYPDARFYEMRFPDFVSNQFQVVEEIYDALELPMTEEASANMRAFIADNPKGKHGTHNYTPEEYGVDPAAVRHNFRDYIERFDLLSN